MSITFYFTAFIILFGNVVWQSGLKAGIKCLIYFKVKTNSSASIINVDRPYTPYKVYASQVVPSSQPWLLKYPKKMIPNKQMN